MVDNFRSNGQISYVADKITTAGKGTVECSFDRKIKKLNSLIPNENIDSIGCRFFINYEYLEAMRSFIPNDSRFNKKIKLIGKEEFKGFYLD